MQTPPPHADAKSDVLLEEDALTGTSLGNYRLLDRIGIGATALVYRAEHTQLGRIYAVKILHPSIAIRPGMRERFLREAKTAGQLNHENIIFIADFAIDPQLGPYMVMEYLEGENLQEVLERETRIPLPRLIQIVSQVCQALVVAQEAGIIHRDLKPENIYLVPRPDGTDMVKILDFGIARLVQSSVSLTGEGKLLGTPLYMSPEQCRGNAELTSASDLYSFGVVLFEMLTGRTPFEGDNPQKLLIDHFLVDPPELATTYPESLRSLQAQLLAKSPEDRPQDINVLHDRLVTALREAHKFVAPPPQFLPEASFTQEQLPALHEDTGEILSELDIVEIPESTAGRTTKAPAYVPHESTQETSYPPESSYVLAQRGLGREDVSTQEQLPAASTPLPVSSTSTPIPRAAGPVRLTSDIAALSSADAVRQSPRWGEELATAAWDGVSPAEQAALSGHRPSSAIGIGPSANLLDSSLTDPSRMTLQGSELSTNDVINAAKQTQPVVVKQRSHSSGATGQDALLDDLEQMFQAEGQSEPALHRSDDQPPLDADEELLRDLDQSLSVPPTGGWTQGYDMPSPGWQEDEPVIELRQKKAAPPPPPVRVARGTGPGHKAAAALSGPTPTNAVRVEKGNKSQPPIATARNSRLPNATLARTELDLSLGEAYNISGNMGEDLDVQDLLQLPTERGESPSARKPDAASPTHMLTLQEGSQPELPGLPNGPDLPAKASPQHFPPGSPPTSPQHFTGSFAHNTDQQIYHSPKGDSGSSPTWIVLLFVFLAAVAGVLVWWLWLK